MTAEPVLECQDCGQVLMRLTAQQAQKVADNPYNYIVWCYVCRVRQREGN